MAFKRKRTSSMGRPGMYKKRRTVKRFGRTALPARMRQISRRTFSNRRRMQRVLRPLAETKLTPCEPKTEIQPTPIQLGAQGTFIAFTLGEQAAFTGATIVRGTRIPQGISESQRIGQYVTYKKTHATVRLESNAGVNAPPIQVRCIMFKARRSSNPAGISPAWDETGFLNVDGTKFGHGTQDITALDLIMQPLNKRQWIIYKDTKFILQPYNSLSTGDLIYNHYGAAKQMTFNMPHYQKSHFPGGALTPDDADLRYTIVYYFHTLGRSGVVASALEASFRGTTSYTDM